MAEPVLEGASLPDGIEVDEAAAYFGVTESSDIVHTLMSMERNQSISQFFSMVSDIILKPGEFDFEEASQRLNCEGGEIYFLVAGHLGVMSLPEQLSLAISEGQFSDSESQTLQEIADPMRLLKLFAIAQQTGGEGEATKYLKGIESLMSNPAANKAALLSLASEVQASFDVAGHVTPVSSLASGSASAKEVETAYVPPAPASEEPAPTVAAEQPVSPAIETPPAEPETVQEAVPLPQVEESVPLPSSEPVPLPEIVEPKQEVDERKDSEKTDDAFSGAFSVMAPEPEPQPEPE